MGGKRDGGVIKPVTSAVFLGFTVLSMLFFHLLYYPWVVHVWCVMLSSLFDSFSFPVYG